MDRELLQAGLSAWFAAASGVYDADLWWSGEPDGARGYPRADLQLSSPQREPGATDEQRREADASGKLVSTVYGHRLVVFTATVRSRDHHGETKADAILASVIGKLYFESTVNTFAALDVVARDAAPIQAHQIEVVDNRELSVASLSITLAYTVAEVDYLAPPIEPIEHVVIGGTVESVGAVPDAVIP